MRIALAFGFTIALGIALTGGALAQDPVAVPLAPSSVPAIQPVQPTNPKIPVTAPPPVPSVQPSVLSAADIALYRKIFRAERAGQTARVKTLLAKVNDPVLEGYAAAARLQGMRKPKVADL